MICSFGVWLYVGNAISHTHTPPAALSTTSNHFKTIALMRADLSPKKAGLELLGHEDPKEAETERESQLNGHFFRNVSGTLLPGSHCAHSTLKEQR